MKKIVAVFLCVTALMLLGVNAFADVKVSEKGKSSN